MAPNGYVGGTGQNDTLVGGYGSQVIEAFGRNDWVYGDSHAPFIAALPFALPKFGDDFIDGGDGLDVLIGDVTHASITQSLLAFVPPMLDFFGGDTILGGDGADELYGDVYGTLANDVWATRLVGGADQLAGGRDHDLIFGDAAAFAGGRVQGGDDWLEAGDGDDTVFGDAEYADDTGEGHHIGGADLIWGNRGEDVLFGDFRVQLAWQNGDSIHDVRIEGGDDVVRGGYGADIIYGDMAAYHAEANDTGDLGIELFLGGDDELHGDGNDDLIYGDAELLNLITANPDGASIIAGDDQLFGGFGADELYGDARYGNVHNWDDGPTTALVFGDDELFGGADDDVIFGDVRRIEAGNHNGVEEVFAFGDDQLFGGHGDDILYGDFLQDGSSDQIWFGNLVHGGNDVLDGGAGDDQLLGWIGNNVLTGGTGDDLFVMANANGVNRITDFHAGGTIDEIAINGYDNFAELLANTVQSGDNTVIDLWTASNALPFAMLILENVDMTSLTEGDFVF